MPHKDPEQRRKYHREWSRKRRDQWFKENGPCVDCLSWNDLELDHNDRKSKVSHNVWSWSKERRETELMKCVARCVKCHRIKTNLEIREWKAKPITHGTMSGKSRGCKCDLCIIGARLGRKVANPYSPIAQWQSSRLLIGGSWFESRWESVLVVLPLVR